MRSNPDIFELRLDRDIRRDSVRVSCISRIYDVHYAVELRSMWGDPAPLADHIERLVGGTIRAWESAGVTGPTGREMAQVLMPFWEREIHRAMERIEYQNRHRDNSRTRMDMLYGYAIQNHRTFNFDGWMEETADPKAKKKARELLMRNLDAGQEKSFKKDGSFRVTAKDGKVYTISTARSFNVKAEDGTRYCGQLADAPVEDQMLAQKLLLEHEPEKFFKNANVSPAPGAAPTTATEIAMRQREALYRPGMINWYGGV